MAFLDASGQACRAAGARPAGEGKEHLRVSAAAALVGLLDGLVYAQYAAKRI
jgi:hypothetical protein